MNNTVQPTTYKEEVAQYTKKDAIHALMFYAFSLLIWSGIFVLFLIIPAITDNGRMTMTGQIVRIAAFIPAQLLALLVLLRKNGQGLSSVGLHLRDWKKNLVAGLLFAVL